MGDIDIPLPTPSPTPPPPPETPFTGHPDFTTHPDDSDHSDFTPPPPETPFTDFLNDTSIHDYSTDSYTGYSEDKTGKFYLDELSTGVKPPGLFNIGEMKFDVDGNYIGYWGRITGYKQFISTGIPSLVQDRLYIGSMQHFGLENMNTIDKYELRYLIFVANLRLPPFSLILLGCSSIILLASLIFF